MAIERCVTTTPTNTSIIVIAGGFRLITELVSRKYTIGKVQALKDSCQID